MNKILIFLLVLFFALPAYSLDDNIRPFEDYNWEMEYGFELEDREEEVLKEETYEIEPEITLNSKNDNSKTYDNNSNVQKLKIEKVEYVDKLRETFRPQKTVDELYNDGKLKIYGEGKKELSDYMTDNFKSSLGLTYSLSKHIDISAGQENTYVNPDATLGSRKFYFNPRINFTEDFYIDYSTRYDAISDNFEQEVGINYKPKIFHDNTKFAVKASETINRETGMKKSNSLKFSTDFYF